MIANLTSRYALKIPVVFINRVVRWCYLFFIHDIWPEITDYLIINVLFQFLFSDCFGS